MGRRSPFNDYDTPGKPEKSEYYRPKIIEVNAQTLAAIEELGTIHSWSQLVAVCSDQKRKRGWG